MTDWRDARLKKALDFAPDRLQAPAKSLGDAIKNEASRALQTPTAKPSPGRWTRIRAWWLPSGQMPWNAALASLLLASLVTLVWRDEDTPGAGPHAPPTPPVATAPNATPPAVPVPPQQAARPRANVAPEAQRDLPPEPPATPVARARSALPADATLADAVPRIQAPAPAAPPGPSVVSPAPAEAMAAAQQPPALRAAPAAKAAQSMARAESAGAPVGPKAVAEAWTVLRVTSAGAVREVLRPSSPDWVAVVRRLLAVAVTPAPLEGEPTLQMALLQGEATLGWLALSGTWVRWAPAGEASRTGQADAALLRDLQALLSGAPATPPDSAR